MPNLKTLYLSERKAWRSWLQKHFDKEKEIWLVYPKKSSGKPRILYNDAVEEALCFDWIDSTVKSLDKDHSMQRFCPRRPKSTYSQANKERLKWLAKEHQLLPAVREHVKDILAEVYVFPPDILKVIEADPIAWRHFQQFSESYKNIRIAYIDVARKRPEEFEKRLRNFMEKTRQNQLISGFGGIDKYY